MDIDQAMKIVEVESKHGKWDGKGKRFSDLVENYKKTASESAKFSLDFSKWLPNLAEVVKPVKPGMMVCLASDTGSGKTLFFQQIITKIASPLKTLFFEMELPDSELVERFVAMKTMNSTQDAEKLILNDSLKINGDLDHLVTYSESRFTVSDIEEIIDLEKPQLVIIDYIGLVQAKGEKRYEKLSNIAEELKLLASVKKVILLVAVQIARKERGSSAEIFLHDCKDSGSIENSCQIMLGLWREGEGGEDVKVKVVKNQGIRDVIFHYKFNPNNLNIWHG